MKGQVTAKKIGCTLIVLMATCAAISADVTVGFREVGGIDVPGAESRTMSGKLRLSPEATFYKTGTGTLTIPSAKIDNSTPYAVNVLAGKLVLSGAAATLSAVSAPDVADAAALWLDASGLTVGASVSTWTDVRGGSGRYSAVAKWRNAGANDRIPPVVAVTNGTKGVYFGGRSGKYMRIQKNSADAAVSKVHHLFVVHGAYDTYGTLLGHEHGSTSRGKGLLDTLDETGGTLTLSLDHTDKHYLNTARGELDWANFQGRFFLDGKFFDPRTALIRRGTSLFEGDMQAQPEEFNAIYYNTFETYKNDTPGGDYVCEVLLFTNHLTEVQRLDVERYLLDKWSLPMNEVKLSSGMTTVAHPPRGTGLVRVADDAEVEVSVGANETSAPFQFDGRGTVVKKGAGMLAIGGGAIRPFAGSFSLEEGSVLVRGGMMPPVVLGKGEEWSSENWPESRAAATPENDATSGVRVVKSVSSDGMTHKRGSGELQVAGVASGAGRVSVDAGVLHLAAKEPTVGTTDVGIGAEEVEIPNASFEEPFPADSAARYYGWKTCNSWINDSQDTSVQMMTSSSAGYKNWSAEEHPLPDGTNALMIVIGGYGYTMVTVPRAGMYELSFFASSRYGSRRGATSAYFNRRSCIEVRFNDRCVGFLQVNEGAYTRYRYRFAIGADEVGTPKKFGFKSRNDVTENCTIIDDIHLKPVAEGDRTDVVKVPGGDFEESRCYDSDGKLLGYLPSIFCRWMTGPDWTLSLTGSASIQNPTNGYVAICTPGTPAMKTHWVGNAFIRVYPQADGVCGCGVLGFVGNCGVATTKNAFKLPKGRWLLRGEIAWTPFNVDIGGTDAGSLSCDKQPSVEVTLTRNGQESSLGSVTSSRHAMERCFWPTIVTVSDDAGEDVSLSIRQTNANGACALDNLVFVPATAGEPEKNLFANGNFETKDYGTFKYETGVKYDTSHTGRFNYRTDSWAFGLDVVNDDFCGRLHNDYGLQMSVAFPAAGLYRLTVPAHTRSDNKDNGHKELRATVVLGDSSELEIFRQPIPFTQTFQEISYLFRMPESGARVVKILGIPIPGGTRPDGLNDANRNTMIDGLRLVKVEDAGCGVPQIAEDTTFDVKEGAKLALDYDGKVTVQGLKLGGQRVHGIVKASDYPEYLTGMGEIEVKPAGLLLIVR